MPTLIRPMLAKTYGDGPSCQYKPGMLVQPKLNGIRALFHNGTFVSRDGEIWSHLCLSHIRDELKPVFKDVILDGELYIHGESLQTINSRCAVVRTSPHKLEHTIQYHIFDYVARDSMIHRAQKLARFFPSLKLINTQLVPTYFTKSTAEADHIYPHFKTSSYEGMMYRCPFAGYAIPGESGRKDNRTHHLLKRKDWLDLEAVIVGMESGDGKHSSTMSSFILDWNGKRFKCSSGPSDLERAEYYRLGPKLQGQRCRLEYRELTGDGTPFHGRIVSVELPSGYNL